MLTQVPLDAAPVPQEIRECRRLRQELRKNLEVLQQVLSESQTIFADSGWPVAPLTTQSPHRLGVLDGLTPREVDVLRLIAEGKSTKDVAKELGIAFKTAVCHRSRILQKVGVHETTSLVRLAIRAGLVEP